MPYIGIVTILMNDYPKFKVSCWNSLFLTKNWLSLFVGVKVLIAPVGFLTFPVFLFASMLSSSCWVSSCWSIESEVSRPSGLKKNELCPGNLTHAFSDRIQFDFVKKSHKLFFLLFFVQFVWMFCRTVDRMFTFDEKRNMSFKVFLREKKAI